MADSTRVDSLMKKNLDSSLPVATKIQMLNKLAGEFLEKDRKLSLAYGKQALYLAQQSNDSLAMATAYNQMGNTLRSQGNLGEALQQYFESLRLSTRLKVEAEKLHSFSGIGFIFQTQGNFAKAQNYFLEALSSANKTGDKYAIADASHNAGNAFVFQKKYEEALRYYTQALDIRIILDDKVGAANSYNNIGYVYKNQGDYAKALSYYQRALLEMKQVQAGTKVDLTAVLDNIGDICFLQAQYNKALDYYLQSLAQAKTFGSQLRLKEVQADLAETYVKLKDFNQAFAYYKQASAMQDTIYQIQNNALLKEIETKYETQEKEKQIELLRKEKEIDNLRKHAQIQGYQLRERRLMNALLVVGLILAAMLVALIYERYHERRKTTQLLQSQNKTIQLQNEELQVTNEKLLHSEEYLLQLNATKDKFFSIISHDLKGPLNTMTGFLHVLDMQVDAFSPEELKDFAKDMNKSVKNLLDLLDNLLQWSRSQTGTIDYSPEVLNLAEIVDDNKSLLQAIAKAKGIRLLIQIDQKTQVYADGNMLNCVFRNLISNAIKFTNPGGLITINAAQRGEQVEISIKDNGIGMSAVTLTRLFQLDAYHTTTGTSNEKGNGLGLILCKEFVENNGGTIWVESEENKGTTFHFTVPLQQTEHTEAIS
ncbi:MAG: tetratricopeptide repeat-containing sensor histidine kinase [Bacteroidota bacterium]